MFTSSLEDFPDFGSQKKMVNTICPCRNDQSFKYMQKNNKLSNNDILISKSKQIFAYWQAVPVPHNLTGWESHNKESHYLNIIFHSVITVKHIEHTLNKRSWAICSQGKDTDIKQHLRGNTSSSELVEAAAAAYACFAATDATEAAFRTIEPIPNPFFDVTGEKGPKSCWLWSNHSKTKIYHVLKAFTPSLI